MTPEEYQALVKRMAPRSPILRDTALAFLVGGAICVVGQLLSHWYGTLGLDDSDAGHRHLRDAGVPVGAGHGAGPLP